MISETAAPVEEDEDADGNGSADILSAVRVHLARVFLRFQQSPAGCRRTAGKDACAPDNMKLRMPEMPPGTLLAALGSYNLLPAIIFLPTRRRCDESASEAALSRRTLPDERRVARREFMLSFVEQHPEIRKHRHWDAIVGAGVASHHAGHMPDWKLVIEKMMSAGLLDAIFATATVAAGVDFPARPRVVTVADRRSATGWQSLT